MLLIKKLSIFAISLCAALNPFSVRAQTPTELVEASIRLKQAHVLRYYENCIDQKRSDMDCRIELEALHPRELSALQKISKNNGNYSELEVSKASAACYSPTNDYKDLVECWETLANKMIAGEEIKLSATTKVTSLSERVSAIFSVLTPTEKRSLVLCVRGRVAINYQETVAHNLQKGGKDALWAMKVNGFQNVHMVNLANAASWSILKEYYEIESANITKLIRGDIKVRSYRLAAKENENLLNRALEPEMSRQAEHSRNFEKFSGGCEELSSKLIGLSKASASE